MGSKRVATLVPPITARKDLFWATGKIVVPAFAAVHATSCARFVASRR
jgi:hypothetical protein